MVALKNKIESQDISYDIILEHFENGQAKLGDIVIGQIYKK